MESRLICISHSPLLLKTHPKAESQEAAFFAAAKKAGDFARAFDPDVVIMFAPDHFNGFFYNMMPQYCVGFDAVGTEDWDIESGTLSVPTDVAENLVAALLNDGFDVATSRQMKVDHGFTIPLSLLFGRLDAYPTIPIFVNSNSTPRASMKRARQLGEAVGRYINDIEKRVLIVGSGGLSHDPPHLPFAEAPPETQKYLIGETPWSKTFDHRRQGRVLAAAEALVGGEATIIPPDIEWDREVLNVVTGSNLAAADAFSDEWISKHGGGGGHEIRNWVAAFAALGAQGRYQPDVIYHDIVDEWITGMAVVTARNT